MPPNFQLHWQYVTSREEFWRSLQLCREYCASDRFVVPPFSSYFVRELTTIEAWCADGRTPQYSERRHNRMGLVIAREITEAGVPMTGEWEEMAKRIIEVGNHFEYWPTDEQIREHVGFWSAQVMMSRRTPTNAELAEGAARVEATMRAAGKWSTSRAPSAPPSGPFGGDSMTRLEWLQFVFLPQVQKCIDGRATLPETSSLTALGSDLSGDRTCWPIMYALSDFDGLFFDSELIDNVKRWPLIKRR